MLQSLTILAVVLFGIGLFGLSTRQTVSGFAVSLQLLFLAAMLIFSTAQQFVAGDPVESFYLILIVAVIAISHLLLAGLFLLRAAHLRRLPILADQSRSFIWIVGVLVLVAVFKLEDELMGSLPPAVLTLVISLGLLLLWYVRHRRQPSVPDSQNADRAEQRVDEPAQ